MGAVSGRLWHMAPMAGLGLGAPRVNFFIKILSVFHEGEIEEETLFVYSVGVVPYGGGGGTPPQQPLG